MLLEARDLHKSYGSRSPSPACAFRSRGRNRRPARPQRRRQDHDRLHDRRPAARRTAARCASTATRSSGDDRPRQAPHRPGAAGDRAVRGRPATNLGFFGALYGLAARRSERCRDALDAGGLERSRQGQPQSFSGGMKRRLNIAGALLHDPDLLLLDEPTVGVDPQSRNAIFDNLEALKTRGKTLVYTTHYMEEAERLCDRIVIVDHGKVIARGTLDQLYATLPAAQSLDIDVDGTVDVQRLGREPGVGSARQDEGRLSIGVDDLARAGPLLSWLAVQGHAVRGVASARATLENVFLALTGRQLRD